MNRKSARLHSCNTVYEENCIYDINPLLLELYKGNKTMLVLCARDGQIARIKNMIANSLPDSIPEITLCGWWEVESYGLFSVNKVNQYEFLRYDAVVILDRPRIHECFYGLLKQVDEVCWSSHTI